MSFAICNIDLSSTKLMYTCRESLSPSLTSCTASCMLAANLNDVLVFSAKLGVFAVTASCAAVLSKPLLLLLPSPYSPLIIVFSTFLVCCCHCCAHACCHTAVVVVTIALLLLAVLWY